MSASAMQGGHNNMSLNITSNYYYLATS